MKTPLTIQDRLTILSALTEETGLIDCMIVNSIKSKVQFTAEEIDYASISDTVNGVTFDQDKPIIKNIDLLVCESALLDDRLEANAEYQVIRSKIMAE